MAIGKILVAHDFSSPANRALRFAATMAHDIGARLEVALVHPDPYDGRGELDLALPAALPGQGERYLRFLEEELRRVVVEVLGATHPVVPCHVLRGDPVKRLDELARELGADVICIGAKIGRAHV